MINVRWSKYALRQGALVYYCLTLLTKVFKTDKNFFKLGRSLKMLKQSTTSK